MADAAERRALPDRDELAATLAIAQLPGIGPARLRTLLAAFDGAGSALQAPHGAIAALPGFSRAAATAIRALSVHAGRRILDQLDALGARVLLATDPEFPPLLREIPEAPTMLYVWGDAGLLHRPAAAMVGSRDHSAYGADAARILSAGVARAAVIVSGMARGIDALVHSAALDVGGRSVGVLGNGFGVIYPAANRTLYERMRTPPHGCLVTELPPGERPHAGAFPRRNRLISGLAAVTVVVEAAPGSGALITADCALDQGRTVLAVPGPITSPTSLGCNKLIQQGAKPALSPADILEELGIPGDPAATEPAARGQAPPDLAPLERTLWDALGVEPRHVDQLVATSRADPAAVLTALTGLEMRGLVRQEPGMRFCLNAG
jgi:DNA processing protein